MLFIIGIIVMGLLMGLMIFINKEAEPFLYKHTDMPEPSFRLPRRGDILLMYRKPKEARDSNLLNEDDLGVCKLLIATIRISILIFILILLVPLACLIYSLL